MKFLFSLLFLIWLTLGIAVNTALIACDSFDRHSISVNKCKCSEENISNNSWFNRLSDENKKLLISLLDEKKRLVS